MLEPARLFVGVRAARVRGCAGTGGAAAEGARRSGPRGPESPGWTPSHLHSCLSPPRIPAPGIRPHPPHRRPSASRVGGEAERQIIINLSWGSRCGIAKNNPRRRPGSARRAGPTGVHPPSWGIPDEVASGRPPQPCSLPFPGADGVEQPGRTTPALSGVTDN